MVITLIETRNSRANTFSDFILEIGNPFIHTEFKVLKDMFAERFSRKLEMSSLEPKMKRLKMPSPNMMTT